MSALYFFPVFSVDITSVFRNGGIEEEPNPEQKSRCFYMRQAIWGQKVEKERAVSWERGERFSNSSLILNHKRQITRIQTEHNQFSQSYKGM